MKILSRIVALLTVGGIALLLAAAGAHAVGKKKCTATHEVRWALDKNGCETIQPTDEATVRKFLTDHKVPKECY